MLADGKSPEEVWAEITRDYELAGREVDTQDIDTAIKQPGSRSHFVVTTNDAELVDLLSGDFEAWRTFLHPAQGAVAYSAYLQGASESHRRGGYGQDGCCRTSGSILSSKAQRSGQRLRPDPLCNLYKRFGQ